MNTQRKCMLVIAVGGLMLLSCLKSEAGNVSWSGAANGQLWSSTGNWSGGSLPGTVDTALFLRSSTYTGTIDLGGTTRQLASVQIGGGTGTAIIPNLTFTNGTLFLTGDVFTSSSGGTTTGITIGADATLEFSGTQQYRRGGTLTINGQLMGDSSAVLRPGIASETSTSIILNSNNSNYAGKWLFNVTTNAVVEVNATGALGTNAATDTVKFSDVDGSKTLRIGTNGISLDRSMTLQTTNVAGRAAILEYSPSSGTGNVTGQVIGSLNSAMTLKATQANGILNVSGELKNADNTNGMLGFQADGSGTVVLSRAAGNSYGRTDGTGFSSGVGTVVKNGAKLLVTNTSGSATGINGVEVQNGSTLGGTGRIAPNSDRNVSILSGAFLAPGNSTLSDTTGTMTIALGGSGKLDVSGTYAWEVNQLSVSSGFDKVNVSSGALVLETGSAFQINITGAANNPANAFWSSNQSWQVMQSANLPSGTFGSLGGTTTFAGGNFSLSYTNSGVYLNFAAAVPEPSSICLIVASLGIGSILFLRKKK